MNQLLSLISRNRRKKNNQPHPHQQQPKQQTQTGPSTHPTPTNSCKKNIAATKKRNSNLCNRNDLQKNRIPSGHHVNKNNPKRNYQMSPNLSLTATSLAEILIGINVSTLHLTLSTICLITWSSVRSKLENL